MKACDRCGKELTDRDRTTICLECEVALADEVIKNLESDKASLKAERDAAVADLKRIGECALCRKNGEQQRRREMNPETISIIEVMKIKAAERKRRRRKKRMERQWERGMWYCSHCDKMHGKRVVEYNICEDRCVDSILFVGNAGVD